MRRVMLGSLAAMAVAFLAILAAIWVATGTSPPSTARPGPPPAAYDPGALPTFAGAPIDLAKAPLGGVPLPPPVIVSDERPPPPPPGSWEAIPILTPRGRAILGVDPEEVQPRLSECFAPDRAARYAGTRVTESKDSAPLRNEVTTLLLLQLEVVGDQALVIDAPVESRGTASDGTIACAQAVLRNRSAPAAGLRPGKYRVRFTLQP